MTNDKKDDGHNPNMAAARRPVSITITIEADETFDISSKHLPVKKGKGGPEDAVITFDNWDGTHFSDGFQVTFDLDDKTGKGYGFFVRDPQNPDYNDALSARIVGPTGHCPSKGQQWDGFVPIDLSVDRKSLTVDNPNGHRQYFGFALHFSLPHQKQPSLTYDPIGDNQNGRVLR